MFICRVDCVVWCLNHKYICFISNTDNFYALSYAKITTKLKIPQLTNGSVSTPYSSATLTLLGIVLQGSVLFALNVVGFLVSL